MYKCILFVFCVMCSAVSLGANFSCSVSAVNINFGTINPAFGAAQGFGNNISVTCNSNGSAFDISYTLTFSSGSSGNISSRAMKNGSNSLGYNLYKDAAYSQILGSGSSGTYTFSKAYTLAKNSSQTDNYTVYAKIPSVSSTLPLTYTDSIIVTLSYCGA